MREAHSRGGSRSADPRTAVLRLALRVRVYVYESNLGVHRACIKTTHLLLDRPDEYRRDEYNWVGHYCASSIAHIPDMTTPPPALAKSFRRRALESSSDSSSTT